VEHLLSQQRAHLSRLDERHAMRGFRDRRHTNGRRDMHQVGSVAPAALSRTVGIAPEIPVAE
jgi:hypothetical protein